MQSVSLSIFCFFFFICALSYPDYPFLLFPYPEELFTTILPTFLVFDSIHNDLSKSKKKGMSSYAGKENSTELTDVIPDGSFHDNPEGEDNSNGPLIDSNHSHHLSYLAKVNNCKALLIHLFLGANNKRVSKHQPSLDFRVLEPIFACTAFHNRLQGLNFKIHQKNSSLWLTEEAHGTLHGKSI